jgi:uracil-DNA glycosylase
MATDRAAVLAVIAEEVRVCTACKLHQGTTNAVPGAGNPNAEIMFIGEGPGFYEDKQGLPFVGRSGDLLNKMLKLIDLERDKVFITNVVKHRPPENRDPQPDEMIACKGYLDRQIEAIDPLVIVTLGRFSMARYFPNGKITQIHGQPKYDERRAYYPLFHPAAVLRSEGSMLPGFEADFKRLVEVIAKVQEMRAKTNKPAAPTASSPSPTEPDEPPTQLKLF